MLRGTVKVKAETEIPKLLSRSWEKLYYITVCCRIEVFLNRDHRIVAKTVKQQKYLECRSFHRHKIHSITFFVFLWLWFLCLQTQLIITEEEREWARWWMLNNWILKEYEGKNRTIEDKQAQITDNAFLPLNAKSEIGSFDAVKNNYQSVSGSVIIQWNKKPIRTFKDITLWMSAISAPACCV